MKACNIFKTGNHYKIITQHKTKDGFLLSNEPVFVLPVDITIDELAAKVFESLSSSKSGVATPKRDEYPILEKTIMQKINERSYASLYKKSSSCDLRLEDNILKIAPEKFSNPQKQNSGLIWVEEDMVEIRNIDDNKKEATIKLVELLNRKYR